MALKLENGRYCVGTGGVLETVSGTEALCQRLLTRLTARRGEFLPDETLGSRLYLLHREKPSARDAALRQFVAEAIAPEAGVTLTSHTLEETERGVFVLSLVFACGEEAVTLNLEV